ncbi:MAG: sigma factor-like helix-turn-helix DNA-binding protein, partial [Solirubrobacteraceae bacterium]
LDMLRSRASRREEPYDADVRLPELVLGPLGPRDPEQEALIADSVGLALLVVLHSLQPAERLAFVLHDMFGVPFEQIAPIVDRSSDAARQLASRARRRVRGAAPVPDADLGAQWKVVEAFMAAADDGNFDGLLEVLDPDVVLRADGGGVADLSRLVRGAEAVASSATMWSRVGLDMRRALVNGTPGFVSLREGRPFSVGAATISGGRIVEMDILADPERLAKLDFTVLDD